LIYEDIKEIATSSSVTPEKERAGEKIHSDKKQSKYTMINEEIDFISSQDEEKKRSSIQVDLSNSSSVIFIPDINELIKRQD